MTPMRVLYLTMNPNRASTTVPTEGWFRFLPARGLEPVLASHELGAFHEWTREQGIPAYHVSMPLPREFAWPKLAAAIWHLRGLVRRHRIELIHSNEQDLYPVAQYLRKVTGVPAVTSVHFTMDRGYCDWAFRGSRAPSRLFFVSQRSLDACRPGLDGIVTSDRWRVLHNGLDLETYQPNPELGRRFREQHGLAPGDLLIGAGCALRSRKQLEHLFEAAARVKMPHLRVVLAGFPVADEMEYAAKLLEQARALLGDRFVFVGELSDMRPLCNALDLFVNTSREESFGISVLEALACGCPVIGYDSRAVDEVVLPDGGEITRQDDIEELAVAVRRWVEDRTELGRRRTRARTQAERFDLRVLSDQLWTHYQELRRVSV